MRDERRPVLTPDAVIEDADWPKAKDIPVPSVDELHDALLASLLSKRQVPPDALNHYANRLRLAMAEIRHYPGKHDQSSHGNWAKGRAKQQNAPIGSDAEWLATGAIRDLRDLETGTSSAVYIGDIDGRAVIVKPVSGLYSEEPLRHRIPMGAEAEREIAAAIVNEALGGLVEMPAIVLRETELGLATVQEYRDNDGIYLDLSMDTRDRYEYSTSMSNVALFDSIIGNLDRHGGNLLVGLGTDDEDLPTLIAIDHGLSFPTKNDFGVMPKRSRYDRTEPAWYNSLAMDIVSGAEYAYGGGKTIKDVRYFDTEQIRATERLLENWDATAAKLKPLIGANATEATRRRAQRLLDYQTISTAVDWSDSEWIDDTTG